MAVTQVSNALGTVVPVREIVELAHRAGARALVDGAQSVSHMLAFYNTTEEVDRFISVVRRLAGRR